MSKKQKVFLLVIRQSGGNNTILCSCLADDILQAVHNFGSGLLRITNEAETEALVHFPESPLSWFVRLQEEDILSFETRWKNFTYCKTAYVIQVPCIN
jgi:hypothetical protein